MWLSRCSALSHSPRKYASVCKPSTGQQPFPSQPLLDAPRSSPPPSLQCAFSRRATHTAAAATTTKRSPGDLIDVLHRRAGLLVWHDARGADGHRQQSRCPHGSLRHQGGALLSALAPGQGRQEGTSLAIIALRRHHHHQALQQNCHRPWWLVPLLASAKSRLLHACALLPSSTSG